MRRTEEESWLPEPDLDEQRYEEMGIALQQVLLSEHHDVRLSIWRREGIAEIKGQLLRIHPLEGTLDVQTDQGETVSLRLEHILEVHPDSEMNLE